MDEAVVECLKQNHGLEVGKRTAERVKIELGSALPLDTPLSAEVRGRDPRAGLPKTVFVTDGDIRESLSAPLRAGVAAVRAALARTPPARSNAGSC